MVFKVLGFGFNTTAVIALRDGGGGGRGQRVHEPTGNRCAGGGGGHRDNSRREAASVAGGEGDRDRARNQDSGHIAGGPFRQFRSASYTEGPGGGAEKLRVVGVARRAMNNRRRAFRPPVEGAMRGDDENVRGGWLLFKNHSCSRRV